LLLGLANKEQRLLAVNRYRKRPARGRQPEIEAQAIAVVGPLARQQESRRQGDTLPSGSVRQIVRR
jgi:hypothetical protein